MKVIILCGGKGERIREETEFKPKPMINIGNKPILWHIMKMYSRYGFNEFILALGYKAEYIKDYFLNQKAFTNDFLLDTKNFKKHYYLNNGRGGDDFKITFVDTGLDALPGERILRCSKYIPEGDKYFMVAYGDNLSDINMKKLLSFHKGHGKVGTLSGVLFKQKYGLFKFDKDGTVKSFREKPVLRHYANGGYMVFDKRFFKYIKAGEAEHPALMRLTEAGELAMYKHDGFWYGMDTYKEVEELNRLWSQDGCPWKVWK